MDPVITKIREELALLADPELQKGAKRFFREEIRCYGIKTATVTALARGYWKEVRKYPKDGIFALCEELYRSGMMEESFIVSTWVSLLADRYDREDLPVFRNWIETYIGNWASCDGFCNHTLGAFMDQFPGCTTELVHWAQSENRWMRRAAAVSLIVPAKQGRFLNESIRIAQILLTDQDDLVQKGYGWLLKEASRRHTSEVFAFVMENKKTMPRTALRYAIELMPADLKTAAMRKD